VKAALDDLFQQASQPNLALLFSLRHDFPTEWSVFVNGVNNFDVTIRKEPFPLLHARKTNNDRRIRPLWAGRDEAPRGRQPRRVGRRNDRSE
jgi:hypothetical protein